MDGQKPNKALPIYFLFWFASLIALTFLFWGVANKLSHDNHFEATHHQLLTLGEKINRHLSTNLESLANLAHNPHLQKVVSGQSQPDNDALVALLSGVQSLSEAAIVYVLNQEGTVIGCSPFGDNQTLTGRNYGFRPYFQQAIEGTTVIYPALGVTTNKRGIYLSSPVWTTDTIPHGVVVMKISLEAIDSLLAAEPSPMSLISPSGVIFATNQKDWLFRMAFPSYGPERSKILDSRQFADEQLLPLPFDMRQKNVTINGKAHCLHGYTIGKTGWQIVLAHLPKISLHLDTMQLALLLAAFILAILLVSAIIYLFKRIGQQGSQKA